MLVLVFARDGSLYIHRALDGAELANLLPLIPSTRAFVVIPNGTTMSTAYVLALLHDVARVYGQSTGSTH